MACSVLWHVSEVQPKLSELSLRYTSYNCPTGQYPQSMLHTEVQSYVESVWPQKAQGHGSPEKITSPWELFKASQRHHCQGCAPYWGNREPATSAAWNKPVFCHHLCTYRLTTQVPESTPGSWGVLLPLLDTDSQPPGQSQMELESTKKMKISITPQKFIPSFCSWHCKLQVAVTYSLLQESLCARSLGKLLML